MEVLCIRNKGYKWSEHEGSFFKGYVQLYDEADTVLREREAIDYFSSAKNFEEFTTKLKECDGVYSVIIRKDGKYWAAVDIARSMPLYYDTDLSYISDSSEDIRKRKGIDPEDTDYLRTIETYKMGYIVGDKTIYSEIKQLDIGQAAEINGGSINVVTYFLHTSAIQDISREEALRQLEEKSNAMVRRMLKVIAGRSILLSLSGGYDSRYVACSFKHYSVENIACYTYGVGGTLEIAGSKRVSNALGYDWHCVEYTDRNKFAFMPDEARRYYDYTIQHDFIEYLQNYTAMKELTEAGTIPEEAVVITGLCNDMPSGAYVPSLEKARSYGFTLEGAARCTLDSRLSTTFFQRLTKTPPLKQEEYSRLVDEVKASMLSLGLEVHDYQSFVSAVDCLETGHPHSRHFLHMNDIHEFFGHQWLLPCWNRELLKFWYSLPASMRYRQSLYEEYVTGTVGRHYGLTMRKAAAKAKNPVVNFLKRLKRSKVAFVGGFLNPFGMTIIEDTHNTVPLMRKLYKLIKQREAIKHNRTSLSPLIRTCLMEERYGTKWFERIRKALN